jgi:hypothetical protein
MGYVGKIREKNIARKLRQDGYSYREILSKVKVSKSTLSLWCRDIGLSEHQLKQLLNKRIKGGLIGSAIGAKRQQAKRIVKTEALIKQGKLEIGKLNNRDRFLAGVMLYAAEGTKSDGEVSFANGDPVMIKFMAKWFREYCKVADRDLRGKLYIHENLDAKSALEYWSNLTKISLAQFNKSYIVENKNGFRKNRYKNGIFTIRTSNRDLSRKIKGWIRGVLV